MKNVINNDQYRTGTRKIGVAVTRTKPTGEFIISLLCEQVN
jgi:hypothetical protein